MIRRLATAAITLVCAAGPFSAAHAAAGAEARIVGLSYALIDLDPADGIAPAFSFVNDPQLNRLRTELTVDVSNTLLGTSDNAINAAFSFIAPLTLDRAVVGNQAHASASPDGAIASVLSEARGHASAFASAESNLTFTGDFGLQLTPHTSMTISATAIVTAFDNGVAGAEGHAFEFGQAESFLRIRAGDPGDGSGPQEQLSTRSAQTLVDAFGDAADSSGPLSVSFANLSGDPLFGYLSVRSTASAFGVSPIPEPPAWALVLGGLVVLASRVRARRARTGG